MNYTWTISDQAYIRDTLRMYLQQPMTDADCTAIRCALTKYDPTKMWIETVSYLKSGGMRYRRGWFLILELLCCSPDQQLAPKTELLDLRAADDSEAMLCSRQFRYQLGLRAEEVYTRCVFGRTGSLKQSGRTTTTILQAAGYVHVHKKPIVLLTAKTTAHVNKMVATFERGLGVSLKGIAVEVIESAWHQASRFRNLPVLLDHYAVECKPELTRRLMDEIKLNRCPWVLDD